MTDSVIVVIGDIVSSRRITDRVSFDSVLLGAMADLNARNPNILSPYTLTIGDEIQAVFGSADFLFRDAISILAAICPEKMRFSWGLGVLTKPINPERAIGMDGPAFHIARDGVEELKDSGYLFSISGEGIPHLSLLRETLFLISHTMTKWPCTRFQTLAMLQAGFPVKDIAATLELSDQAIYKTIDAGVLDVVIRLFNETQAILNASR